MGRHRSPLKQALDIKSKLFALSRLVTLGRPCLRRLFSFYPEARWPEGARTQVVHRSVWAHPWRGDAYRAGREAALQSNVDSMAPSSWAAPDSTERFAAIVAHVIVPGHRVTPVDPVTGAQIVSDRTGLLNWNRARPSFSALRTRTVSDDLTIVIPKMTHFGHLLTDVLMPHLFALQILGFSEGRKLNVVTSSKPVGLITAFIGALREAGYETTHIAAQDWETIAAPRLLHAASHSRNLELKFSNPETLDFARKHFLAALPAPPSPLPKRIFLLRGATRTRQVEGEHELASRLESIGFTQMVGRWSNLSEQIAAFHEAEVVVAAHGAGLANILWSGPKTLLIEICAHNARKTTGLHWSSCAGARYRLMTGSDESALQNFTIDVDAAFAEIRDLIGAAAPAG